MRERESHTSPVSSGDDLSDGQVEDMVEDLHNLLFLHGPQPLVEGEGDAARMEEQEEEEREQAQVDELPPEYRYLRQINYNQPRQPRRGDIVKYFDFNFDGWLRVRVTSQHKKSSKYAGSVNCVFLDIQIEPDGLFFYFSDFWSILSGPGDDPEPVQGGGLAQVEAGEDLVLEVEREEDVSCLGHLVSSRSGESLCSRQTQSCCLGQGRVFLQ